jgi:F-type H+-transporting ATPase subunit b
VLTFVIHLPGLAPHPSETSATTEVKDTPGPIVPELKELYWSAGAFIVFALLMRFFLFPRLKKGMDARYGSIRSAHENADAARSGARGEVAEYERQLAAVKAEAAGRLDAARQTLEGERQQRIAALNAQLAERKAAAQAETDAAKAAARGQIHSAVADVATRAGELATGRRPEAAVVTKVVDEVMAR